MNNMKSLADTLGIKVVPDGFATDEPTIDARLTGKSFAEALLDSQEFRTYITAGLANRDLPAAVLTKLMDHGWGKPVDHLEVTNKDSDMSQLSPEQLENKAATLYAIARELREQSEEQMIPDDDPQVH